MVISPLFIAVSALAIFLVGLSKSGFATSFGAASVPMLALVMDARDAAGMMLPLLLIADFFAVMIYRRSINWKIIWIVIPGAMVGTLIGWALSAVVSEAAVGLAVGIISVAFALDAWLPLRKKLELAKPSRTWGMFWGGVAGFTSFISHTGGPPYQVYTMPLRMEPLIYAGTASVAFAIINTSKLVPYYFLGQLSVTNLELAAALLPALAAGMLSGVWLIKRVPARLFYHIAYVLIFVFGLKLIYDGAVGLMFAGTAA